MSNTESFEVTWEADDGYCGGSAPQHFEIHDDAIEGLDEKGLRKLFWEEIDNDFQQKVSASSSDEERFIAWAKKRQKAMEEEGA